MRIGEFEGPFDLLLEMIRRQKLDVFDIPIARIAEQFLAVIARARELNLDVAGEYLVMATTLMQIKARMLLPRAEEETEGEDPRAELVVQLVVYEELKALAERLAAFPIVGRDVFTRGAFPEGDEAERPRPAGDLEALLTALRRLLARSEQAPTLTIVQEELDVRARMQEVVEAVRMGRRTLAELLGARPTRGWVVVTVLALLELWRLGLVRVVQTESFAPVWVEPACAA